MKTLHFEITINATKEKVWDTLFGDETYKQWTEVFSPSGEPSYMEGSWEKGSEVRFVGVDENGKKSGMLSRIADNRPYEFLSIEHYGEVRDGIEDTTSERAKSWAGAHENYTLSEENDATKLVIDVDTVGEFEEYFNDAWPKALDKLKQLAETSS